MEKPFYIESHLRYLLRNKWLNFSVYPVLSLEGQKEWEQIEEALYREELTMQGYNKYRRVLFQKENLISQDGTENEKPSDKKKDTEALVGAMSSDAGDHTAQKSFDFHSKEECSKVNKELCSAHESVLFIAPAGFCPRGQNPRRHYSLPRVYV